MITHVAIRFEGLIYSLSEPNRHHNVISLIVYETGIKYVDVDEDDQGFLTDEGVYLRRKPALIHAEMCGQVKGQVIGGRLYSENLW